MKRRTHKKLKLKEKLHSILAERCKIWYFKIIDVQGYDLWETMAYCLSQKIREVCFEQFYDILLRVKEWYQKPRSYSSAATLRLFQWYSGKHHYCGKFNGIIVNNESRSWILCITLGKVVLSSSTKKFTERLKFEINLWFIRQ